MTNKRTTKKAPAEAGAVHAGLSDSDWAINVYISTQFDWQRCKAWIATLPDAPLKEHMIERMARGDAALLNDNIDGAKRDYEFLLMSQRQTELMQHLVPLAKRDVGRQGGSSKGGKNKPVPGWHKKAIEHAQALSVSGRESHELASLCARKLGKSDDAVRKVLQDAGLVRSRKTRVK